MNWYGTSGTGSQAAAGTRSTDPDSMCGNAIMYDAVGGKILTVGGAPAYTSTLFPSWLFPAIRSFSQNLGASELCQLLFNPGHLISVLSNSHHTIILLIFIFYRHLRHCERSYHHYRHPTCQTHRCRHQSHGLSSRLPQQHSPS